MVTVDGANGQQMLTNELKETGIKLKVIMPKTADIIAAGASFERLYMLPIYAILVSHRCHSAYPTVKSVLLEQMGDSDTSQSLKGLTFLFLNQ